MLFTYVVQALSCALAALFLWGAGYAIQNSEIIGFIACLWLAGSFGVLNFMAITARRS